MLKRRHRTKRADQAAAGVARRFAEDAELRRHAMRAFGASQAVAGRVRSRRSDALTDRRTTRNLHRFAREVDHVASGLDRNRRRSRRPLIAGIAAGAGAAGGAAVWMARQRTAHREHADASTAGAI
jgi:hypothetical protein